MTGISRNNFLIIISGALMILALFLILIYVPTEKEMGIVQRIFYFHVPLAWVAFLAFFVVFLGSVLYLRRRDEKWDRLAHASAEVGMVFTSLVLITGPIWAKPIWGAWWTWDVRLTTTLVLWFIYLAYLMVRGYAMEETRGARFAAVLGIIGFIDVPIVALAISLWRTQHPGPVVFSGGLAPSMLITLIVSITAFTCLYACLLIQSTALRGAERESRKILYARKSEQ